MLPLLLASSSAYRRDLLARLRLPFSCSSPDIDESHRPGESAIELVKRLSRQKAEALATRHPDHLIIGSDQVAALNGRIIGKPQAQSILMAHRNGHATRHVLNGGADELAMLIHVHSGRLAGGADDDDAVGAFGDVPVDEAAQAGEVQAAVVLHGRDDGDKRSGNQGVRQ